MRFGSAFSRFPGRVVIGRLWLNDYGTSMRSNGVIIGKWKGPGYSSLLILTIDTGTQGPKTTKVAKREQEGAEVRDVGREGALAPGPLSRIRRARTTSIPAADAAFPKVLAARELED